MKIVLLSTSDITGGAAVVSKRLIEAFRSLGHEASMVVLNHRGETVGYVEKAQGKRLISRIPFYRERAGIYLRNGLNSGDLFKVSTASTGIKIAGTDSLKDADAILLGWINQGFLSLKEINRIAALGKPVIWTMHDMWCFTGICHLSGNCSRFKNHCGDCPYLNQGSGPNDLSARTWRKKNALYKINPEIQFVAVSNWLAGKALESSLLCKRKVHVIPNAYPLDSTEKLNEGKREPVIVIGASRLDDSIKNLPLAIDAVNLLYSELKDKLPGLKFKLFGNLRDKNILSTIKMPYEWLGPLKEEEIRTLFNNSRVVLSSSFFEMLPTTIIEGLAWGCVAVATDSGGQRDIIMEGKNGFLVSPLSAREMADALCKALKGSFEARALRQSISSRFSPKDVASKYLELISRAK